MNICQAKLADTQELAGLFNSVIQATPYYSEKARAEEIKKHNAEALKNYFSDKKYYLCLVAEEDDKIVGFAIGRNEAGVFWADWVGVHKNQRRKGVAESLIRKWETYLKRNKVHKIWCDTRTTNKKSISLLKKLGYKKLGIFKNGWYKQDFILWEKDIESLNS